MIDTIECPYCKEDHTLFDPLTDLPSDNTFDEECEHCGEMFQVYVEFEPTFSSDKIIYTTCEICKDSVRDVVHKERTFPFPEHIKEKEICRPCYRKEMLNSLNKKVIKKELKRSK